MTDPAEFEQGGESACYANRVCPDCGRLNEGEHPVTCAECGARLPAED